MEMLGFCLQPNVAARGLDIPEAELVQRLSTKECEPYIHHSGQTGRAGGPGLASAFPSTKNTS